MMLSCPFMLLRRKGSGLASVFGTLELRVLEVLWQRGTEASVRDILQKFPHAAYTTVMTTMERLHRKGALLRRKDGRAFLYTPAQSREQLESTFVARAIEPLLNGASAQPILSCFVEEISRHDERLLDELERLVQLKRRRNEGDR
ncbi:MAG TPA: BlaI/MecI/CopY family transcriptional regulator [Vicinamibacterales bacterium]|nr:BlaI/MecI/CopY family transcriptional regulator [Vicinamibacterales bacterium]